MIKFSQKNPVAFCWIMVNVFALIAIGVTYLIAYQMGVRKLVSLEQIQAISHSATREQLATLFVDGDAATRGLLRAIFLMLYWWLGLTILNVLLALLSYYHHKQKASS